MGRNPIRNVIASVASALALTLLWVGFAAAGTPAVSQFNLPAPESKPAGIATGSDGGLWFTQRDRNRIGRIPPNASGTADIEEIDYGIPGEDQIFGAEGIASTRDGALWFSMNPGVPASNLTLGRIALTGTPGISFRELSESNSQPRSLASGRDGNLWFTRGTGNKIGRITPVTPFDDAHFEIPPPPGPPGPAASPQGITLGPDGNLWFTQAGRNQIGRVTTGPTPTFTNFQTTGNPIGITPGPDGNLWFVQPTYDRIARITPAGTVTEFDLPGPASMPTQITSGPDGKLWFSETGGYLLGAEPGNRIGRIDPVGTNAEIRDSITEFALPSPRSAPTSITSGPDGAIWFTQTNGNRIGRITTALDPPDVRTPLPDPNITIPSSGSADPYPSELQVSIPETEVTRVRVDLYGLFHAWPEDLDVLLVGPEGQKVMLLSDAGFDRNLFGNNFSIDDDAPFSAPQNGILATGRYRPTDHEPGESMPGPAPAGPYGTDLSVFNGTNPNGTWQLYIADDTSLASGRLLGWGLKIGAEEPEVPPIDPPVDPPIDPPIDPPVDPPVVDLPARAAGGFVKGLREVLVDRSGRALIELSCPAQRRASCRIALKGRVRAGKPVAVPQGTVKLARVKLPARLWKTLDRRRPKVTLKAGDLGQVARRQVRLRRVPRITVYSGKGKLKVLIPHAGDARRLQASLLVGRRRAASRKVTRIARGRVKNLTLTLNRRTRQRHSFNATVKLRTIPVTGSPRNLSYRIKARGN